MNLLKRLMAPFRGKDAVIWDRYYESIPLHTLALGQFGWNSRGLRNKLVLRAMRGRDNVIMVGSRLHLHFDEDVLEQFLFVPISAFLKQPELIKSAKFIAVELGEYPEESAEGFHGVYEDYLDSLSMDARYLGAPNKQTQVFMLNVARHFRQDYFSGVIMAKSRLCRFAVTFFEEYATLDTADHVAMDRLLSNVGSLMLSPYGEPDYKVKLSSYLNRLKVYRPAQNGEYILENPSLDELQWLSDSGLANLRVNP